MTDDEFYDSEIAPILKALSEKCVARGIQFLAWAQYGEVTAMTRCILDPCPIETELVHWAMQAKGNVDSLMLCAERHARNHGHSSVYLYLRGVPMRQSKADGIRT